MCLGTWLFHNVRRPAAPPIAPSPARRSKLTFRVPGRAIRTGTQEVAPVEGGEDKVSKNELKRRQKQADKERLAAEKAAAKKEAAANATEKPKIDAAPALEELDEDIPPEKYFESRLAWVDKKKAAGINPYPHKFHTSMQLPQFHATYNNVESGGFADAQEAIAGVCPTALSPLMQQGTSSPASSHAARCHVAVS